MSQYNPTQDGLEKVILQALTIETERVVLEAIATAQKEVEKRIREQTAAIVCAVHKRVQFERFGQELVIRVNFDNTKTP